MSDRRELSGMIRRVLGGMEVTILPNAILEDRGLTPEEKLVMIYLRYVTDHLVRTTMLDGSLGVMIVKLMAKADTEDPDLSNILSRLSGLEREQVDEILDALVVGAEMEELEGTGSPLELEDGIKAIMDQHFGWN